MLVLLSNDDGIDAAGLSALERALDGLGELWTVAPATEQSARSHSFTMNEPLRVIQHGERRVAVTGTPADSVYLAIHSILPRRPALVVSGINRGSNLSTDVIYSGTVAAAREGVANDIPALAVSLHIPDGETDLHWPAAEVAARKMAEAVVAHGLPPGILLNINVPNLATPHGIRIAPMGRRRYAPLVHEQRDPRGRSFFWIGGPHERFDGDDDSDGPLCEAGFVVVTPLQLDLTATSTMATLRTWEIEH